MSNHFLKFDYTPITLKQQHTDNQHQILFGTVIASLITNKGIVTGNRVNSYPPPKNNK